MVYTLVVKKYSSEIMINKQTKNGGHKYMSSLEWNQLWHDVRPPPLLGLQRPGPTGQRLCVGWIFEGSTFHHCIKGIIEIFKDTHALKQLSPPFLPTPRKHLCIILHGVPPHIMKPHN